MPMNTCKQVSFIRTVGSGHDMRAAATSCRLLEPLECPLCPLAAFVTDVGNLV